MNSRARTTALLTGAVLAAAGGGACTQDFPPFNRLDSLRVLAIQAEPAAPLTGETTTLTPLIFTPGDPADVTYRWSWCPAPGPAEQGYKCLITEEELTAALGGATLPSFYRGESPTATLENALPAAALAAICGGTVPGLPAPNCSGGFPVQIALDVTQGGETVQSVVTVKMRFDGATQAPNANPKIDDLTAFRDGTWHSIPTTAVDDTFALPRDAATRLKAVVVPEASEIYDGLDETDKPAQGLHERLYLTWFIESGDTDNARTSFIFDRTPFETMLNNTWTPAVSRLYPDNTARLYVVIHDSRGGVGWRSGIVQLEPTP
jgi:hypothetical protein